MQDKIKIDVVSDVVCPWCVIGYKRLEKAIKEMGYENKVELEWHPFELNPSMPNEGQNLTEHLMEKYGSNATQLSTSREHLVELGADLGFTFNFKDDLKIVNTRKAHALLDYAKSFDKQSQLSMHLVEAYFSHGKDVSNHSVLAAAMKAVGIPSEDALSKLTSEGTLSNIAKKEHYWTQLGISSVPTIVFNLKSSLTGAQPLHVYKQVLHQLVNEQNA